MATIFDLSENTAPDGTDRLYITDGTNDEGVQIANLLKGSGAEVPAAKITGTVSTSNLPTITHEKGGLEADVSAYDGMIRISGGSTSNLKSNFSASAAPAVTDDNESGYVVGSRWIDTTNDAEYVCVDNTLSAAVWVQTTGGGGGGGGGGSLFMEPFAVEMSQIVNLYNQSNVNAHDKATLASSQISKRSLVQSNNDGFIMQGSLPSTMTSITRAIVLTSANATSGLTLDFRVTYVGEGDSRGGGGNLSADTGNTSWYTQASTYKINYVDISSLLSSAVAGDHISVGITFTWGNGVVECYGCLIEYS